MFKHDTLPSASGDGKQEIRVRGNHGVKQFISNNLTFKAIAEQEKIYEPTSNK